MNDIIPSLAQALKAERPGEHWDANKRMQWNLCVKAVARVVSKHSITWQIDVFVAACGGLFDV